MCEILYFRFQYIYFFVGSLLPLCSRALYSCGSQCGTTKTTTRTSKHNKQKKLYQNFNFQGTLPKYKDKKSHRQTIGEKIIPRNENICKLAELARLNKKIVIPE